MNPISKLPRRRLAKGPSEDLTCSEGQIEELLSEGESTEVENEDEKMPEKHPEQNTSSRKTASTNVPKHQQK